MDIQEIQNRKEDQTFDCKSIQVEPKANPNQLLKEIREFYPTSTLNEVLDKTL